jgi:hypothetical protein
MAVSQGKSHLTVAPMMGREEDAQGRGAPAPALVRYLDVIAVVLVAPLAIALGAPVFGYLVGAGAWIATRVLAELDRGWIRRASEPRTQLGLHLFEAFGRIWLLAGAIIVAGVAGGRADGLTAALTIFGAYSVAFGVKVLFGPPEGKPQRRRAR